MKSRTARTHLTEPHPPDETPWNPIDWRRWRLSEARKAELTNWPKHQNIATPQIINRLALPSLVNNLPNVVEHVPVNEYDLNHNDHASFNQEQVLDMNSGIRVKVTNDGINDISPPYVDSNILKPVIPNSKNISQPNFMGSVFSAVEASNLQQNKFRHINDNENNRMEYLVEPIGTLDTFLKHGVNLDTQKNLNSYHEHTRLPQSHNYLPSNRLSGSKNEFERKSNRHESAYNLDSFPDGKLEASKHQKNELLAPCQAIIHLVHNDLTASTHTETILRKSQDLEHQRQHLNIRQHPPRQSATSRPPVSFGEHDWTTTTTRAPRVLTYDHPGMHTDTLSGGDIFMKTAHTTKSIEHSAIGALSFALVVFIVWQMGLHYRRRSRSRAGGQTTKERPTCFPRLRRLIGPFSKRRNFNCSLPSSAIILHPPQLPGRPVRVETPGVATTNLLGMVREGAARGAGAVVSAGGSGNGKMDIDVQPIEMRRRPGLAYNSFPPLSIYAGVQSSSSDYPGSSASRQSSCSGAEDSLHGSRPLGPAAQGHVSRQLRSKSLAPSVFLVDARGPYAAGNSTSPFWRTYQPSSFTTSSSAPISSSTPSSSSSFTSDCDFRSRYVNKHRDAMIQQRMEMATGFSTQQRSVEASSAKWSACTESDVTNNKERDSVTNLQPSRILDVAKEAFIVDVAKQDLSEEQSFGSDAGASGVSSLGQSGCLVESEYSYKTTANEHQPEDRPAVKPRTRRSNAKLFPKTDKNNEEYCNTIKMQKVTPCQDHPAFHGNLEVLNKIVMHTGIEQKTIPLDIVESTISDQPTADISLDQQIIKNNKEDFCADIFSKNGVSSKGRLLSDKFSITFQRQQSDVHKLPIGVATISALLKSARSPDVSRVDVHGSTTAFQVSDLIDSYEQEKQRGLMSHLTIKPDEPFHEKDSDSSLTNVSSLRASFTTSN